MTREAWVAAHPYLSELARLHDRVEAALDGIAVACAETPAFDQYADDFAAGVPLFSSPACGLDLVHAGEAAAALLTRIADGRADDDLVAQARVLSQDAERHGAAASVIADWLLGGDGWRPAHPGTLRFLGWSAARRALAPALRVFEEQRDDDRWLRPYCPACGCGPAMAQLTGKDPGRRRLMHCGHCGTRWRFGRTACPFCHADAQRLAALAIDGAGGLRIDFCETCRGYLKTYDGEGAERVLLADWTSIHLDAIASDRGLRRTAASLYELDPASVDPEPLHIGGGRG